MPIDMQTYQGYADNLKETFSSPQWKAQPTDPIKGADGPADVVANYLYGQIYTVARQQEGADYYGPNQGFRFGCLIIASGIARSRDAYLASCLETGQAESSETLESALLNPRSVNLFSRIAGMSNPKAGIVEGWFGLQVPPTGTEPPFLYNPQEHFIEPNPVVLKAAGVQVAYWAEEHQEWPEMRDERPAQCPARRFIPMLWKRAVQISLAAGLLEPSVTPGATSVVR